MTAPKSATEQLHVFIEGVRREAYQQGFDDAVRQLRIVIDGLTAPDPTDMPKLVSTKSISSEPTERKPAGHNKRVVLDALWRLGGKGATQAQIIRLAESRGESLAQSSVRHALKQLQGEGHVRLRGRKWLAIERSEEAARKPSEAWLAAPAPKNSDQSEAHDEPLI